MTAASIAPDSSAAGLVSARVGGGEGQQRGVLPSETLQVEYLVVGRARLPALPQDANPLEGQRPHGHLMARPFGALLRVVGPSPEAVVDRFGRVLDQGLADERGAEVAPPHPHLFAAALGDGRDPGQASEFVGRAVTLAACAEDGQQSRGIDGPGAGQGVEQSPRELGQFRHGVDPTRPAQLTGAAR